MHSQPVTSRPIPETPVPGSATDAGGDSGTRTASSRPVHLRASSLILVFVGGTLGVAAREALIHLYPAGGGVPWAIFGINLSGAFLLGVLLDALVRRGPDHGMRQQLRLLVGTGFMGGFTTYSSLATDTADLLSSGSAGAGIGYGVGTVVVGGLATGLGIVVAGLTHRNHPEVSR